MFWTIPIIYVFWPTDRNWYGSIKNAGERKESRTYSTQQDALIVSPRATKSSRLNDDSDSSDEDETTGQMPEYGAMGT